MGVGDAVLDGENRLGVLGRHPEQAGDPHPEQRPGTACGDGGRHPGDVAGPHRRGERGHQGLEVADVSRGVR